MPPSGGLMTRILSKWIELDRSQVIKILTGIGALSILAQFKIYLPMSPVPVTGQTFGVALLALLYGRKLGSISVLAYLALGSAGLPIFAGFKAGLIGPSMGYLLGMFASSYVIGSLSDLGAKKSFPRALAATYAGSLCVFSLGAIGLSFFMSWEDVFFFGVFPFLAGDLVKNLAAATIATKFSK